jgi:6-phosphogluconolactonase
MSPSALADTFAYVGNADSNEVSVFRLDPASGDMTPVETAALAGVEKPGGSTPLAVSPDKRLLFVGVRSEPFQALSFAIDAQTGRLKQLGSGPLADSMASIATDRSGRFLLGASYGGNKVAVNPIGADGIVQPSSQVVPTGPKAHLMIAAPDNRHVLATNLGSDELLSFRIDPKAGTLTPADSPSVKVAAGAGPRHFVFGPDGKFVYLLGELDAVVRVLAYDADTGGLRELQHASALPAGFAGKPWAADIHVTPDGRFLYASERTSSTIAGFAIDSASGQLTPIGSFPTEKQPRGFNIDSTGGYLAAVGELSNGMSVYSIDQASGTLTKLAFHPTGRKPNWVEFVAFP